MKSTANAMTNELTGAGLSPQTTTALGEMIAYVLPVITAAAVALWRRAAGKSKLQSIIIEAIVRGINSGKDTIGEENTQMVKRAVKDEAQQAGVQQHLEKIVTKVNAESNGLDGGHI